MHVVTDRAWIIRAALSLDLGSQRLGMGKKRVGVAVNGVQVNVTLRMSRAKISQAPPRFSVLA